tara:strand:- start:16133 stop:16390 length:258 start_codon:yes stop_codon:yes gene_type:complete
VAKELFGKGANVNRRPSETINIGPFSITFSWHPETGKPYETFIVNRGKPGELNDALSLLGVAVSKFMQGEDIGNLTVDGEEFLYE